MTQGLSLAKLRHEKYRWTYMRRHELERRLGRMTNIEKIQVFISVAEDYGNSVLRAKGMERLEEVRSMPKTKARKRHATIKPIRKSEKLTRMMNIG